jgi:hypothetical protein
MYTSAIAKEITVRDIDRNYKKLHGNGKKKHGKKSVYIQNVLFRR